MKRMIRPFSMLATGTLVGFFISELIIRSIIGAPLPETFPLARVRADPDIGWRMLPNDFHYTYVAPVKLNSLGFRGPELGQKSPSEYRILTIGDSHIYGQGLRDEELLTHVLQKRLNTHQKLHRHRVVNLGVRAYSMNNELAMLNKIGLSLEPEHVLWCFYIDDFNPSNIDRWYRKFANMDWYMFDLLDKPTTAARWRWNAKQLLRKSAFLMSLNDTIRILQEQILSQETTAHKILRGIADPKTREKIQLVKNGLDKLMQLSRVRGFTLTLVLIPEPTQLAKEFPNNLYQRPLLRYAREVGLDVVDLRPALRDYYLTQGRLPLLPFDGHYNAAGQAVMAEALALHLTGNPTH